MWLSDGFEAVEIAVEPFMKNNVKEFYVGEDLPERQKKPVFQIRSGRKMKRLSASVRQTQRVGLAPIRHEDGLPDALE